VRGVTQHPKDFAASGDRHASVDADTLEAIADWKENLQGKIERLLWCLNLHLLDGFDRDELEQLKTEVSEFRASCLACKEARK
jgi:hypothetical protein